MNSYRGSHFWSIKQKFVALTLALVLVGGGFRSMLLQRITLS